MGPKYRFPYGFLQPDLYLGPYVSGPHTDFEANRRDSPMGPKLLWALPETLLAL